MNNIENERIDLGGFNDFLKMRDGWMVYNKNDFYVGRSIHEYGEWSQQELNVFRKILSKDDLVIEVGANIGSHTIALSKMVSNGIVFAFEPQRIIFQTLCANLALNSIINCFCYESALSDSRVSSLFMPNFDYALNNNYSSLSLKDKDENYLIQVNIELLDEKFDHLQSLKLLKIDTEGMEYKIIKGGVNLIKRTKPFLYIENNGENSEQLIDFIFTLGYRLFWHMPPLYNKDNYFDNQNNIFGNLHSCNMIGVNSDFVMNVDLPEVTDITYHPLKGKLISRD